MDYNIKIINDIDELVDNLNYLKNFIENNLKSEDELSFLNKINSIHTEIQLLSKKLKYKKR